MFGDGRKSARIVVVGEMAGDYEDRQGQPFVGPAGREIDACMPWLDTEIKLIRPQAVVALGATAAKALIGPTSSASPATSSAA